MSSHADLLTIAPGESAIDLAAVARMRACLKEKGLDPDEEPQVFTDRYIHEVMEVIKEGKKRTFEYALEKLATCIRWRRHYGADKILEAVANNQDQGVLRSLAPGHMFWSGEDAFGRPILYAKPSLMDLATFDRHDYERAHVYLLEQGLRRMRPGVTSFVLVADATGFGIRHLNLALMRSLLELATVGYPDRLGLLVAGPVGWAVRAVWAALSGLMSSRMRAKISLARRARRERGGLGLWMPLIAFASSPWNPPLHLIRGLHSAHGPHRELHSSTSGGFSLSPAASTRLLLIPSAITPLHPVPAAVFKGARVPSAEIATFKPCQPYARSVRGERPPTT